MIHEEVPSSRLAMAWLLLLLAGALVIAPAAHAEHARSLFRGEPSGQGLYQAACAACHGEDGRGAPQARTGLDIPLPDFADCDFARREPDQDWLATLDRGGPARGFDERMPAFGHALTRAEVDRIVAYLRSFCRDHTWPKGELNLPRALLTEKAFPEDELVLTSEVALRGALNVDHELVYEKRFGKLDQLELVFPFSVREQRTSGTVAGVGDLAVGWKRVLFHDMRSGSIVSVLGEVFLPTGIARAGFGSGTFAFEPSLAFGQFVPLVGSRVFGFVQAQAGVELPVRTAYAERSWYARGLVGMSVSERGWGRMWSPMLELMASRAFDSGARTEWDYVPQLQVTLSRRRHVRVNGGMRMPLTGLRERPMTALAYLLWDWYDGGLFAGW